MENCLKKIGCPSIEELRNSLAFLRREDYLRGRIVVIECIE